MEASEVFESITHASASPNGHYVAGLTSDQLYIYYTSSLSLAAGFPLSSSTSPSTRSQENPQLHWTSSSLGIIVQTSSSISIFSLANTASRVKIANGSAGLGRIAAVETVGDNVVVVWEFGRVGLCDLRSGRITEVGECKTGIGSLRAAWGIRRPNHAAEKDRAEVLAILGRTAAQDTLSFLLLPNPTPLKTLTLPTQDAQNLASSPDGKWLSILDSSLSAPNPSIHIFTADGNFFRSWPSHNPADESTDSEELFLGPQRQAWGTQYLALANADGGITLLDTRTFGKATTLTPRTAVPTAVYRETASGRGERGFSYLGTGDDTTSAYLASSSAAPDLRFDASSAFLAVRTEAMPDTVVIWTLPATLTTEQQILQGRQEVKEPTLLHLRTGIRKLLWHPTQPLLLIQTEDNGIFLFDTTSDSAPTHLCHPFNASSSTTPDVSANWISPNTTTSCILTSTKKRGWALLYPFGRPEPRPASPIKPTSTTNSTAAASNGAAPTSGQDEDVDDSQDSLFDILHGRTPLPALSISDPRDADEESGLEDTFHGKGTVGTVDSFDY